MNLSEPVPARYPRVLPSGDRALVVELSDGIDEETNSRVIALAADLSSSPIEGIVETVPTYRSLLVVYEPSVVRGRHLGPILLERLAGLRPQDRIRRRIIVPVLYGGEVGLDLDALAEEKGMSRDCLIDLHASASYRVYMIGFAPGFAYLGGLPEALHTPRLATPRQRIEASAVGIGGRQASINSVPGPSGWRFLGRTPLKLFDPERPDPFLLRAGDEVRFRPVGPDEANHLDNRIAAGEMPVEWETA